MRFTTLSLVITATLFSYSVRAAGDSCDAVLSHGIYDFHATSITKDVTAVFLAGYCEDLATSKKSSNSSGFSLSGMYEGIEGALGYNSQSGTTEDFKKHVCSSQFNQY